MGNEILIEVIKTMMDCLEECMNAVVVITTKKLKYMLLVCASFLILDVIAIILKLPMFITWQIPLIACIILSVILSINYWNKGTLNKFKEVIGGLKSGERRK